MEGGVVKKTIKAKIIFLTKSKEEKIKREFINFQKALRGEGAELYSATEQQAERLRSRLKNKFKRKKKYPLIVRNDCIRLKETNNKLCKYWTKIPVYKKSIYVAIAFPYKDKELLFSGKIRETKLKRHRGSWYLLLTFEKEVKIDYNISSVLSCDLGEKHFLSTVLVKGNSTKSKFYGDGARGIRRHYSWLRRRLQEKKLLKKVKEIGRREKLAVNQICHEISKEIVRIAKENKSAILLGDLKNIRKSTKGKRFNRIVSSMPFDKLSKFIEYKAEAEGVPVVKMKEWNSSKTCHICNNEGKRVSQGLFKCPTCDIEYNADLNGAINLFKRFSEHVLENGVVFDTAQNLEMKQADAFAEPRIS
jgi:putative transposase